MKAAHGKQLMASIIDDLPHCEWAQALYLSQKSKGKSHQAAVRTLAYKWIRIIWKCWQTREKYDEARYVECLRQKGSKLVAESVIAETRVSGLA